ncbi:uncharacterized protein NFIA_092590 [Aspergillus fischeri NRRL 181]|uniref:Uncharacterized protein n=1 Tax=Neosartorya fischeri (strain ATCC 1020 / DSM 3700 / CBS 544.65 / FGSC A1164 / JCM 1740 / NRRL 181 / WB 181) TaxID=331117 RepID=A1DIU1_NEOFI|nr:uncharacterized protein NFIA_092590 [Aspergillus fischeri NRRL 181]EAW19298.1 hypothetical protein NFIA_092590 [Aspergillus fischeri NRRL 181]
MDIQYSGEEATKDPVTGATFSPQIPSVFPQMPKERQIIKKDGSYDIDPGKSPTKASSR